MRQTKTFVRSMIFFAAGIAFWHLMLQTSQIEAQSETEKSAKPRRKVEKILRTSSRRLRFLSKDWYCPKYEALSTSACSYARPASITQQIGVATAPIEDVWNFYARKVTPSNKPTPKWSTGLLNGQFHSGSTDKYQYMIFQDEQLASFIIQKKDSTIHISLSNGIPGKTTRVILTADERAPMQAVR